MRCRQDHAFQLLLIVSLSGISCARPPVYSAKDNASVIKVAREYRENGQHNHEAAIASQVAGPVSSSAIADEEDLYVAQIRKYFNERNFDELEKEAQEARIGKGRFAGGVWKLFAFYLAVSKIPDEEPPIEAAWNARLTTLKMWESARPKSVTARVALAEAYVNYAWDGRGSGSADTVTQEQWKLLEERAELARSTLIEAARLKDKCPYWYEAMQHVAQAQGWKKSEASELMEQAVLFEPGYYHYYREYAYFLEPRWYGEPGEAEGFAEEISNRVGGREGAFLYFEIASLLTCQCNPDPAHMANLSWPKIKTGYLALNQLYGVSNLKRNRYAYMAYLAGDKRVAGAIFFQIGDDWDKEMWGSKQRFETIRAQATSP